MEKFCTNCGNEFKNNEMFCIQCGARREGVQPAPVMQSVPVVEPMVEETALLDEDVAPVYEPIQDNNYAPVQNNYAPVQNNYAPVQNDAPAQKKNKFDISIVVDLFNKVVDWAKKNVIMAAGIGGGALLVLILIIVLVCSSGGYTKPLDNYVDLMEGDISVIADMAPEAYWEYYEDELDMDIDDALDNYEDLYEDSILESMEEEYGEGISISYDVLEKKELKESKLDDIRDGLKSNYDIPKKSVTDGMKLEVELTIEGDEDEDSDEMTVYVAKIDGDWYMVSEYGSISFFN